MESVDKNILALVIFIFSIYILLRIIFNLDTKIDRYSLIFIYLLVLILGLLRPDEEYGHTNSNIAFNPFGFISDIINNESSILILFINLIIFIPMYILLNYANIFKGFLLKVVFFELFAVIIEVFQLYLNVGVCDLSDIFLYNIGFFIGYILFLLFLKVLKRSR